MYHLQPEHYAIIDRGVIDQSFREMPAVTLMAARYQLHKDKHYSFDPFDRITEQVALCQCIYERYLSPYSVPSVDMIAIELDNRVGEILDAPYDAFNQLCSDIQLYFPGIKQSVREDFEYPVVGDIGVLHRYSEMRNLPQKAIYRRILSDFHEMVAMEEKILNTLDINQPVSEVINKMDRLKIIISNSVVQLRQRHKILADHFRDNGLGRSDPSPEAGSGPSPA
jgi:hypothetical protein